MCKFCEGDPRKAETDSLIDGGEDSLAQIAMIVGAKKWEIARYARHRKRAKENASPGGRVTRYGDLYAMLQRLLRAAMRKGESKRAVELTQQLADLHKLEAREEREQPTVAQTAVPISAIGAIRQALGFAAEGTPKPRQVHFDIEGGSLTEVPSPEEARLCELLEEFAKTESELHDARKGLVACAGILVGQLRKVELEPGLRAIVEEFVRRLEESDEGSS